MAKTEAADTPGAISKFLNADWPIFTANGVSALDAVANLAPGYLPS
jgi:hypothetical protein